MTELPETKDILLSTAASLVNLAGIRLTEKDSLVNLAGIRLTEKEHKSAPKAKEAIDAARELLPMCPQDKIGPIKDALSQVQMLYVKESDERAQARSKIWTPPGA